MSAAPTGPGSFLKSADTSTSAQKSQAEIERMLRRYGATGFLVEHEWAAKSARLRFTLPATTADADPTVVEFVVNASRVLPRLPKPARYTRGQDERRLEQAERVAWRHAVLFIDAALAAVASGIQTAEEAFMAHTVVRTDDGREGRLIDYLATMRQVGHGRLPALTAGDPHT